MIPKKTKDAFMKELSKSGSIYAACFKIGIDRSTFYAWKKKSKKFAELAEEAIAEGRENMTDISEHALMMNVKKGDMRAITYQLSHNSPRYKRSQESKVVIEHRKVDPPKSQERTLEDEFDDLHRQEVAIEMVERLSKDGSLKLDEQGKKRLVEELNKTWSVETLP